MDEDQAKKEEVFEFLDDLRESGITNMFGAAPYVEERFGIDKHESHQLLRAWMDSFAERHPTEE